MFFGKLFGKKRNSLTTHKETTPSEMTELSQMLLDAFLEKMDPARTMAVFQGQRPEDDDFGYSITNPICTESILASADYLSRLRTTKGEKFLWLREGSVNTKELHGVDAVDIDIYLIYLNGSYYGKLYICPYAHNSNHVPRGLTLDELPDDRKFGGDAVKEADDNGLNVDQYLSLLKIEYELAHSKEIERQKVESKENRVKNRIKEAAASIKTKYPQFDFEVECQNKLFMTIAASDVDVITIYEYIYREDLFEPVISTKPVCAKPTPEDITLYCAVLLEYVQLETVPPHPSSYPQAVLVNEANREGLTVPQFVAMKKLERNNAELRNEEKKDRIGKWAMQAFDTKQQYPEFDFSKECKKELFWDLIEQVDVTTAYELLHFSTLYTPKSSRLPSGINDVEKKMFCYKCGELLPPSSVFCYKCGAKVVTSSII